MDTKRVMVHESTVTIGGGGGKGTGSGSHFVPTPLGTRVVEYLMEVAPDTVDIGFTAAMEAKLDNISNHELEKNTMLSEFYRNFEGVVQLALDKQKEAAQEARKARAEAAETGTATTDNGEKRPKNVIRMLGDDADVVKTRYGPALYVPSEKRFVNIQSFMEWKGKSMEELTRKDATFLKNLPVLISNTEQPNEFYNIHIGQYGLYAKRDDKNYKVSKELWACIYEGTIGYKELYEDITANLARPKWDGSRKSGWSQKKGWQKGRPKS
jgi:hypothetical protein